MSIVEERYSKWLNHENLAPQYKPVLEAMNAEEKNDAFYATIEFGTAGMRGLLGPGTNRINIHTIRKATQGYANYINENNGGKAGIAIGYDNRHMSKEFAFDCADLLAKNNIKSYVFESLRPTPELSFAVRHLNCFGGIMITASHNPKEYNGYKLYDDKGCQLIPCLASQVIDKVNAIEDELAIDANCTEEQKKLQSFVMDAPTPRKIGLLLGFQLGLRIGEICGLKWGDFDLSAGTVTIQRTVTRISCGNGHTKVVVQSPKTQNSHREIPIPKSLLRVLKKLSEDFSSGTWFLSGNEEKPVEPRCYRKSIYGYLKKASVHQAHPHALRHTFATTCLQAHCDIKTLSELLGHADAAVTLKKYVHSDMTRKRREINRIFENF